MLPEALRSLHTPRHRRIDLSLMAPPYLKRFRRKPSHLQTSLTSIYCLTRGCLNTEAFRAHRSHWPVLVVRPNATQRTRDRNHRAPCHLPRPFSLLAGHGASCPTHCGSDVPACQGRETTCTSNVRVSETYRSARAAEPKKAQKELLSCRTPCVG